MAIALYQHPAYKALAPHWIKWRDLYEGDHETLVTNRSYLHSLGIEDHTHQDAIRLRRGREQRTRYFNVNEIVVSIWVSIFFQKKYSLGAATQKMLKDAGNAEANIDGHGTSLESFIKDQVAVGIFNYGRAQVLADSFPMRGASLGQEKALGIRAFLELLNPLAVVDWQKESTDTARLGKYRWLRHEYDMYEDRKWNETFRRFRYSNVLSMEGGKYLIHRYRTEVTEEGMALKRKDQSGKELAPSIDLIETIETDLTEIPLATYESESWVKDVSEENLRGFNLRSVKDQVEYEAGYRPIFLIGDGIQDRKGDISSSIWPILPGGSNVIPIEPVNTTNLQASIDNSIELAFKMGLNQLRAIAAGSKETQAADSQAAERLNTTALVESSIGEIETLMNASLKNFAAVMGKPDFEPELELNRELSQQSFEQWSRVFEVFSDLFRRTGGEVLDKALAKKAVKKLELDDESERLVMTAIDSSKSMKAPAVEEVDPIAEAMNGDAGR